VWSKGKKSRVTATRLVCTVCWSSAKFAPYGVYLLCFEGKGRLHFVEEKAMVNAGYYMNDPLLKLVEDWLDLLGDNFIFQQDGAPADGAKVT